MILYYWFDDTARVILHLLQIWWEDRKCTYPLWWS